MGKIYGGGGITTMPVPDWKQTNPNRADYIKNKPEIASAIKCTESGEAVRLDDVSPLEYELPVKVESKNLCETNYISSSESVSGKIILNNVKSHGTYTLSCLVTKYEDDTASRTRIASIVCYTDGTEEVFEGEIDANCSESDGVARRKAVTFTTDPKKEISYFRLYTLAHGIQNTRNAEADEIQFEKNPTATPFTFFVTDLSACPLVKMGKNVLNLEGAENDSFVKNSDGSYTLTFVDDTYRRTEILTLENPLPMGTTVTFSANVLSVSNMSYYYGFWFKYYDGTYLYSSLPYTTGKHTKTVTFEKPVVAWCMYLNQSETAGASMTIKDIQIEFGSSATEYEPYTEPTTYEINGDGRVEGVTSLYPTTTLMTDAEGVTIEAEYNKDTKKYIDRKFAEMQALILEV